MPIPIIDLFAGPGGLGEGFASLAKDASPAFEIKLSIEKTAAAHRTLMLRAVFRHLRGTSDERHYYSYIRGEIDSATFRGIPVVARAFEAAGNEARCIELGKTDNDAIDGEIRRSLHGADPWVLIGGPPCQAYSVAGRSRRAHDKTFQNDEKHFLYREYLRIIREHRPAVFVMENVKGLLSASNSGHSMFERIIGDLSRPAEGLEYEIGSFVKDGDAETLEPTDFLIEADHFGIPQRRQRVILLGMRRDASLPPHRFLAPEAQPVTVKQAIGALPHIRSRLSHSDSFDAWRAAVAAAPALVQNWPTNGNSNMVKTMRRYAEQAVTESTGGAFIPGDFRSSSLELAQWLRDDKLGGISQHVSRSHMASDLARYLFAASFADLYRYSPRLEQFPVLLLPDHRNVHENAQALPFRDRFRVQCRNDPASTIVSHIAKDGHYYIHYDPSQCRSLTVREAARLQTFPDNYYFEGNRTEQYIQVGNAVPPLLASKLAATVRDLLSDRGSHTGNTPTDDPNMRQTGQLATSAPDRDQCNGGAVRPDRCTSGMRT